MESQMSCNMSNTWSLKMPKGLDLEISHHPLTMRRVVNLIIAMERLKSVKTESLQGTEFRDEHLLNIMLESIVEERIILERSAAPSEFSRRAVHQCTVTDSQKRSLVQNSMELYAVMLQGGSDQRKVHLNMCTYVHPATPTSNAMPVALGIKDTDLYLSCHKDGDNPTLCLEEVTDKDSLRQIGSGSEMVRFLFYKQDTGVNNSTLMSARYPNWYISTATENSRPVEMCQETATRYRTFNIERQS